jgi:hypothetical protein
MPSCGKQISKQNFALHIYYSDAITEATAMLKTAIKKHAVLQFYVHVTVLYRNM